MSNKYSSAVVVIYTRGSRLFHYLFLFNKYFKAHDILKQKTITFKEYMKES